MVCLKLPSRRSEGGGSDSNFDGSSLNDYKALDLKKRATRMPSQSLVVLRDSD